MNCLPVKGHQIIAWFFAMRAETALQSTVAGYLNVQERLGRLVWWPTPNGTQVAGGTPQERAKRIAFLKHTGMLRSGIPDLCVLTAAGFVFIELKTAGGRISPDQALFQDIAERIVPECVCVCRSLEDVQAIVEPLMRGAA